MAKPIVQFSGFDPIQTISAELIMVTLNIKPNSSGKLSIKFSIGGWPANYFLEDGVRQREVIITKSNKGSLSMKTYDFELTVGADHAGTYTILKAHVTNGDGVTSNPAYRDLDID